MCLVATLYSYFMSTHSVCSMVTAKEIAMSTVKYTFKMSLVDIDKATEILGRRAVTMKDDMHKVLTSLLAVWHVDGDARKITERMAALTKVEGYYSQAIIDWAGCFAGFEYDTTSKAFTYTNTTITLEQFQAAKAEPFFKFSPAKEPTPYDFGDKLTKLLATAGKRAEKPKEGDTIDVSLLGKIQLLVEAHNAAAEAAKVEVEEEA